MSIRKPTSITDLERNFVTTHQFALKANLKQDTVQKHIQRRNIKAFRCFGIWIIPKSEIERFEKERRPPGRPAYGIYDYYD